MDVKNKKNGEKVLSKKINTKREKIANLSIIKLIYVVTRVVLFIELNLLIICLTFS